MFYLCSTGSNLEPHRHVGQALDELITQFGWLQLSSVIRTKPVGMHSRHDFLNCLFVIESRLETTELKQWFVTLEVAHGRDRNDPLCKVHDRPLDIDILASSPIADFATARVDSYLAPLLAEWYGAGEVHATKVALFLCSPLAAGHGHNQQIGLHPVTLQLASQGGQGTAPIHLDAGPRHVTVLHQ
ncbi:2-amino-4-hydroxy-6-hydroxymethyldihydropteridine diphosphokinase [Aeromonas enteropelogenes]|uniref:2-amino-4-hydroxy-6- hydroxymethyldihydropteridine diphosphokinase n=1 Tax=Aeromonas enteropelogenes TaxID=29489 RepID=UPI003BA02E60